MNVEPGHVLEHFGGLVVVVLASKADRGRWHCVILSKPASITARPGSVTDLFLDDAQYWTRLA